MILVWDYYKQQFLFRLVNKLWNKIYLREKFKKDIIWWGYNYTQRKQGTLQNDYSHFHTFIGLHRNV